MSDPKKKPRSRMTDVFASQEELEAEEITFLPKAKPPAPVQPPIPAQEPENIAGDQSVPTVKKEKTERSPKDKPRRGRPPKGEAKAHADRDTVSSIRMDPEMLARINNYVGNRYALYKTKVDLVRYALTKALDELEPLIKKSEKLYETHLGKGKGGSSE